MRHVRLKMGPGAGNRLLAAGLPDLMVVAGSRRIWVNGSCVWDQRGEDVEVADAESLVGLMASQERAVMAWRTEAGFQVRSSAAGDSVELSGVRDIHLGLDWVVVDRGMERSIVALDGPAEPQIPVGARDARPKAWAEGCGVTWIDGSDIYTFQLGGRTRLAGRVSGAMKRWISGPHGAAVFETDAGVSGMAAAGALHPVPQIDVDTVRFGPDGQELIAATGDGVVRWSLAEQRISGQIQGRLYPAGYSNGPVLLDEDVGTLRMWSGDILATGFTPCAASVHKDRLYGPGGTAWSIDSVSKVWQDAPLAGAHLMATEGGVVQVDDRIVGFDLEGQPAFNLPLPIDPEVDGPIYSTHWIDGLMYFEVEHGWIQIDFEGRRVGANAPPAESGEPRLLRKPWRHDLETGLLSDDSGPLPIVFDGAISRSDRGVLAWSEDGLLCSLTDH